MPVYPDVIVRSASRAGAWRLALFLYEGLDQPELGPESLYEAQSVEPDAAAPGGIAPGCPLVPQACYTFRPGFPPFLLRASHRGQENFVKKRRWFFPLCPATFGLLLLLNCLDNPRIQALRGPDILRLIAVGMFFGAAVALFFAWLELKPEKEQHQDRQR